MKTLFTTTLVLIAGLLTAQTVDQENLEKYWKYRDQLRMRFMRIGVGEGESIPASVIIPNRQYGQADQTTGSIIQWRDASISLGYYWIVLATEYKLLSENNQDVQPTLNELYYAMNAFNRLDMTAEDYLAGNLQANPHPEDLNGFFIRDDVHHEMALNFANDPPIANGPIQPDPGHPNQMRADFEGWTNYDNGIGGDEAQTTEPYQPGSESLDQLTTILLGLRFIERMVPNIFVKPTEDDAGMYIYIECLTMIKRVVEYLNDTDPNGFGQYSNKEWTLLQAEDETVHNGGSSCVLQSYPMIEMIKELLPEADAQIIEAPGEVRLQFREGDICIDVGDGNGEGFDDSEFMDAVVSALVNASANATLGAIITHGNIELTSLIATQGLAWSLAHCTYDVSCCEAVDGPVIIEIPIETIKKIWEEMELSTFPLHSEAEGWHTLYTEDMIFKIDGVSSSLPVYSTIPIVDKISSEDNIHIMLEQALLGNVWGPDYVRYCSYLSHLDHIPMLYDLLFTNSVPTANNLPKTYYQALLTAAPCSGPYADPYSSGSEPPEWASPNRLFHPGSRNSGTNTNNDLPDPEYRGYFPGVDYMVYHNAYYLSYAGTLPVFKREISCNCIDEIVATDELITSLHVTRKFQDYKEKGIPAESYLAHSLLVDDGALLDVQNDLVICRENPNIETVLTIDNGSELKLHLGNTITVRNGNKIIIDGASTFTVGISGNATIILEENAQLIVRSGSTLFSPGGIDLEMKSGAQFIVEDAAIDIAYGAAGSSINADDATLIHFENSQFNMSTTSGMVWNMNDHGSVVLDNSIFEFGEIATMNLSNESELHLNSGSYLSIKPEARIKALALSEVHLNAGELHCYGNSVLEIAAGGFLVVDAATSIVPHSGESYIELYGTIDFPAAGVDFVLHETNGARTVLVVKNCANHTTGNSTNRIEIQGNDPSHLVVQIDEGACFHPSWNLFEVDIENGKVIMDGNFDGICNVDVDNVQFEGNGTLKIQADNDIDLCTFNTVDIEATFTTNIKLYVNDSFFNNGADVHANGGGYSIRDCVFAQLQPEGIHSENLTLNSDIQNTSFLLVDMPVVDDSNIDITIKGCDFYGGSVGVQKTGGKLNLRCNRFEGYDWWAVEAGQYCWLNMSSNYAAGYNEFYHNELNIKLTDAMRIDLANGHNTIAVAGSSCSNTSIEGNLTAVHCTGNTMMLDANHNAWTWGGTAIQPQACEFDIDLPGGCTMWVYSAYPELDASCGQYDQGGGGGIIVGRSTSVPHIGRMELHPAFEFRTEEGENPDDPFISTETYTDVPLSIALADAASYSTFWNETGNNAEAIDRFCQILMDSLDRTNSEVRWKMKWGQRYMKTSLENTFSEGTETQAMNESAFSANTQKYVNVLNQMTDFVVSDSTYTEQFYLEIDKAQLYRTIGQQQICHELLLHVDDCELDSLEQAHLNFWLASVQQEMQLIEDFQDHSLDSSSYAVDSTQFQPPITCFDSQFYFGAWIAALDDISYAMCDGFDWKDKHTAQSTFSVFPNPTNGRITLVKNSGEQQYQLQVTDHAGKMVLETTLYFKEQNTLQLDLGPLSSGAYSLRIIGQERVEELKLVVE